MFLFVVASREINREMEMKKLYFSIKRIIYSLILINLILETNKKVIVCSIQ